RCPYRYFADRVLGLSPVAAPSSTERTGGLAGTEVGDAVPRLLEAVPLEDPDPPARAELEVAVRSWYPTATDEELDRIAGLVEAYCGSELAHRLAGLPGARPERAFAFGHGARV